MEFQITNTAVSNFLQNDRPEGRFCLLVRRAPVTDLGKPPRYRAHLLILWKERTQDMDASAVWCSRPEDPRIGKRRGLAAPEALIAALRQDLSDVAQESAEDSSLHG